MTPSPYLVGADFSIQYKLYCAILAIVTHSKGVIYYGKKVKANLKFRVPGGKATAGPPVGSILGQYGLKLMDFVGAFNDQTKDAMGKTVTVHLKVYEDRTFTFTGHRAAG